MDIRKIKKLIDLLKQSEVGEIEVKSGEESVRISLMSSHTHYTQSASSSILTPPPHSFDNEDLPSLSNIKDPPKEEGHTLKSPMVGTVYLAATPGDQPFVEVGQHVNVGDQICIIEAMKMFNSIEADSNGVISARLIENGEPVEFNQALFVITPDA